MIIRAAENKITGVTQVTILFLASIDICKNENQWSVLDMLHQLW